MWRLNGVTQAMLRWNTTRVFSKPETHALPLLLTPTMFRILGVCFGMLVRLFRRRRNLFLEILALRQQLAPPSGQQRGVQTFPTKESTDSTACCRNGFGFFEDALLIFCGGTPLGFGYHLRIRPRSCPRIGARFGCRCTALRLARRRAFASFRGSQTPRRRDNTKRIPAHL